MTHKQIVDEASEWFVTLRHESADRLTQERFMAWMRRSPEHVRAYLDIVELWSQLPAVDPAIDAQALLAQIRAERAVVPFDAKSSDHAGSKVHDTDPRADKNEGYSRRRFTIAACAALLGVLAVTIGWLQIAGA